MFIFIIPVKSKQVSGSWEHFERLFERTVKSVCNQTDKRFKVLVACHERPTIKYDHPDVEYIEVDFPVPQLVANDNALNISLKEADKANKILAGYEYAKKWNPDYIMVVDADDCISNSIVAYALAHQRKSPNGWYFKSGYFYKEGSKLLTLNKNNFNTLCGTCTILKPDLLPHMFEHTPYLIYKHSYTRFKNHGTLSPFPRPSTIYSMANGENHFMSPKMIQNLSFKKNSNIFSILKSIRRKLMRYSIRSLNATVKKEFGLYSVQP